MRRGSPLLPPPTNIETVIGSSQHTALGFKTPLGPKGCTCAKPLKLASPPSHVAEGWCGVGLPSKPHKSLPGGPLDSRGHLPGRLPLGGTSRVPPRPILEPFPVLPRPISDHISPSAEGNWAAEGTSQGGSLWEALHYPPFPSHSNPQYRKNSCKVNQQSPISACWDCK